MYLIKGDVLLTNVTHFDGHKFLLSTKTSNRDNAFCLVHFPLDNGRSFYVNCTFIASCFVTLQN